MARARPDLPLEPRGLSRTEAAAYVGIGPSLFDRLVKEKKMPRPRHLDGRVIWDRRQLDRCLDALFDEAAEGDPYARVQA